MNVERAAEALGRKKMAEGSVFGWSVDTDRALVTFLVPEDAIRGLFPSEIGHCRVELVAIPTPEALSS